MRGGGPDVTNTPTAPFRGGVTCEASARWSVSKQLFAVETLRYTKYCRDVCIYHTCQCPGNKASSQHVPCILEIIPFTLVPLIQVPADHSDLTLIVGHSCLEAHNQGQRLNVRGVSSREGEVVIIIIYILHRVLK